jgi:hypothetical protein
LPFTNNFVVEYFLKLTKFFSLIWEIKFLIILPYFFSPSLSSKQNYIFIEITFTCIIIIVKLLYLLTGIAFISLIFVRLNWRYLYLSITFCLHIQIYLFIKDHEKIYSIEKMCKVLKVDPSSYYNWKRQILSERQRRTTLIKEEITSIYFNAK